MTTRFRRTDLEEAARCGNKETVKTLLEDGNNDEGYNGWSPLHYSVCLTKSTSKHTSTLATLTQTDKLARGINVTNRYKSTPLHYAVMYGNKDQVEMLLRAGADVHVKDHLGWTPLHYASCHGRIAIFDRIVEKIMEVNGNENVSMVKMINSKNNLGRTALHLAAAYNHTQITQTLIKYGANIEECDQEGKTPLMLSATHGAEGVVEILLRKGAKVEAKARHDCTALMFAFIHGKSLVVDDLVQKGALTSTQELDTLRVLCEHNYNYKDVASIMNGPEILFWGNQNLTDSSLEIKLKTDLEKDKKYNILLLNNNKLETFPNLTKYKQFNSLLVVNLSQNKIGRVINKKNCVPGKVEKLYMQNNQLEVLTSFTKSLNLVDVWLQNNNITSIEGSPGSGANIVLEGNPICSASAADTSSPVLYWGNCNLTDIRLNEKLKTLSRSVQCKELILNDNNIENIPNLKDLPQFKTLEVLNLANNQVKNGFDEDHLPSPLQRIYLQNNRLKTIGPVNCEGLSVLWLQDNEITTVESIPKSIKEIRLQNNPVEILGYRCFEVAETYNVLSDGLTFFQKKDLKQPPFEIFNNGFKGIKLYYEDRDNLIFNSTTRLVLIGDTMAGKTSLVWSLRERSPQLTSAADDRTTVVDVYELKANEETDTLMIYDQGGHPIYSITNQFFISRKCIVLIAHNISFVDSLDNIKVDMQKIDRKLHDLEVEGSLVQNTSEMEVQGIEENVSEEKLKESKEKLQHIQDNLSKTEEVLLRTLHQFPECTIHFVLTHIDEIEQIKVGKKCEDFKEFIYALIQKEINSLHKIAKDNSTKEQESIDLIQKIEKKIQEENSSTGQSINFFAVSSKDYSGISELWSFLEEICRSQRDSISKKWIKCYKMIRKQPYLSCDKDSMRKVYKKETGGKDFDLCLKYLSDTGLVLWYGENNSLENKIFPHVKKLIDIMKGIFHHDMEEYLAYDNDRTLQSRFMKREFEELLKLFQEEGLLCKRLWKYLYVKKNVEEDEGDSTSVIDVMKQFYICHETSEEEVKEGYESDQFYFFPWFIQQNKKPENIDIDQPIKIKIKELTLQYQVKFHNRIPLNLCEMFIVNLQGFALENHLPRAGFKYRIPWKDGLAIKMGSTEYITFRHREKCLLNLCISGDTEDLSNLWEHFFCLYKSLKSLLKNWHGVIQSNHVICSHCILVKQNEPEKWRVVESFKEHPSDEIYFDCKKEKIPMGLVSRLSGNPVKMKKQRGAVIKYLEQKCTVQQTGSGHGSHDTNDVTGGHFDQRQKVNQAGKQGAINKIIRPRNEIKFQENDLEEDGEEVSNTDMDDILPIFRKFEKGQDDEETDA